jgi:D-3-phosphoglycerate dehydrogenase
MRVYVPEPHEIHPDAIKLLKSSGFEIDFAGNPNTEILFVKTLITVDKKYLSKFKKLKFILRAGVGLDNIDLVESKRRGIKVFNAPGSNSNAVAEYVVLVSLTHLRNIANQISAVEKGEWRDHKYMGGEVKGRTIGIVGCGAVGKLVAKKFSGFEPKVILGYDPFVDKETLMSLGIKKAPLKTILRTADIICLLVPMNKDTYGMIGHEELRMIKNGAILINASRGGIINENALIEILNEGKPLKVALDVYENEPKVREEFLKFQNIVTTPHIASYTQESQRKMSILAVKNLLNSIKSDN